MCHILPLWIKLATLFIELFRHMKLLSNSTQDNTEPFTVLNVKHDGNDIFLLLFYNLFINKYLKNGIS